MVSINKKVCAVILGVLIMYIAVMPADAQWRRRDNSRGISGKEKAAWIGGGAAAGAVLGGLLNGKAGAILGGVVGAGAGTGVAVIKDRNDQERFDERYRGRYYDRRYYGNTGNGRFFNNSYNGYNGYNNSRFVTNNGRFVNNGRRCR